jgi:hypothetical protein
MKLTQAELMNDIQSLAECLHGRCSIAREANQTSGSQAKLCQPLLVI